MRLIDSQRARSRTKCSVSSARSPRCARRDPGSSCADSPWSVDRPIEYSTPCPQVARTWRRRLRRQCGGNLAPASRFTGAGVIRRCLSRSEQVDGVAELEHGRICVLEEDGEVKDVLVEALRGFQILHEQCDCGDAASRTISGSVPRYSSRDHAHPGTFPRPAQAGVRLRGGGLRLTGTVVSTTMVRAGGRAFRLPALHRPHASNSTAATAWEVVQPWRPLLALRRAGFARPPAILAMLTRASASFCTALMTGSSCGGERLNDLVDAGASLCSPTGGRGGPSR